MPVAWTEEQKQVIDLRDNNILVSAAAGSGKTAVLVERIISRITDPVKPIDIDRLLVVTFTKAAAGEMRERIGAAIEKRLGEEPDNVHLQRQSSLLHHAQITTIDSFCSYVVRNYFHKLDVDPGFRMGEDGELTLLMQDVAGKVLEEAYQKMGERFLVLMESYATGKSDSAMEDCMITLYQFSMSMPLPGQWLKNCMKFYQAQTEEEMQETDWMRFLQADSQQMIEEALFLNDRALSLIREAEGPRFYEEALLDDRKWLTALLQAGTYQQRYRLFADHSYARLSGKRDPEASEEKKSRVKALRETCKDLMDSVKEQYYREEAARVLEDLNQAAVPVTALVELTQAFARRYAREKKERNILDFADLEHFALEVLVEPEEGPEGIVFHYTEAAREFAKTFEEVMIDEYQDSNYVQELLLTAVSRIPFGEYNMFMVGDVKQSIYRFRLARPEIFMEKYQSYREGRAGCQRIDLHKNFRSRSQVLDSVNDLFRRIMSRKLGNVEYDRDAELRAGAVYPQDARVSGGRETELLLVETDDAQWLSMESGESSIELEARAVGGRIRKIVGREWVFCRDIQEYRPASYRDCVILLRTMSGWAETFGRVLEGMGIPVNVTSRTGYFSAREVMTILNYLHICDNPLQDIPFAGVLYSPIGECTANDLSRIRTYQRTGYIADAARAYMESDGQDRVLQDKLRRFFAVFDQMRRKSAYLPIHQLLWEILEETGYLEYARALPAGEQRYANLQMLLEKAREFENTSYRGLFHFIRYIEHLQKYQYDLGEASTTSELEDTVRIMSVHKSKGLEFPIVFASGMGKKFNLQDTRNRLILHMDYGVGADAVDYGMRVKSPTLLKKVIQRQLVLDSLGEEIRVLYVALTRAKEKLILTGTVDKLEKRLREWRGVCDGQKGQLPFHLLAKASCYLDWILPALEGHKGMEPLYQRFGIQGSVKEEGAEFQVTCLSPLELTEEEVLHETERLICRESFLQMEAEEGENFWEHRFGYQYPFADCKRIPQKISVSDLKAGRFQEEEEVSLYQEKVMPYIPRFMRTEEPSLAGAARGSAYHRVMECLDYSEVSSEEEIRGQIKQFLAEGRITREMADCICIQDIWTFVRSALGQRMQKAQKRGGLYREKQFFLEISASRLRKEWPEDEKVLVQGIMDAFFWEEEGLVLVDYKTDQAEHPRQLADKYRVQLESYGEALERLTGKPVKEKIIYSFTLAQEILLS